MSIFMLLPAQAEELLDSIVAVVDDNVIMRSELDKSIIAIRAQIEGSGNQLPPADILEKQVLERLIMQEVQIERAEQAGIRISEAELNAALARIAQQNSISLEEMRMAVEKDGFKFSQFIQDMRRDMQTDRVRNAYANSEVKISEHEIDLFLADNKLDQGEVDLEHILIATPTEASPESIQKAKSTADEIYTQLTAGENFAILAAKHSDGQNALEGGKLGWRPINQLPPMFADLVKTMDVGEVTHPIRSPSGFHLLKLREKRTKITKMVEKYNALHLMVETNLVVSPKDGMKIANNLYDKLIAGEDFSVLAEEKSDDHSSAPLGGDMGWFEINFYGERFGNVIKGLSENDISRPFQTEAGWHIVKYLGKKETDVTDEYKRGQASKAIRERKTHEIIEAWLRQIRGEAFVDIRI